MRTIAHVSDLHFGREDPRVATALLRDLEQMAPSVVVVSGDLTQRARRREFAAARDYLARVPAPLVVVPGNHDVPLWDVLARFTRTFDLYREYISGDLGPLFRDDEIAVLGVNTARAMTFKGGRISQAQIAELHERLSMLPGALFKTVVTHHQLLPPPGGHLLDRVGRGARAFSAIEKCGVELLLAGHLHLGYTGDVRSHYPFVRRSVLVVLAGTAISTRVRGEPNGYNKIAIDRDCVDVERRLWDGNAFLGALVTRFRRLAHEWVQQPARPGP